MQTQPDEKGAPKLWDYPLPGTDIRLGDATVADLEQAAAYHRSRAVNEEARTSIYDGIARLLKRSKAETVHKGRGLTFIWAMRLWLIGRGAA